MATKNIVPRTNNEGQLGRGSKRWAQGNFVTASFTYMSGSLIPHATNTYDLGSAANMWKDIYVSSGSIKFVNPSTSVVMHELKATADGIVFQSGSGLVANVSGSTISGSALHIEGDGKITGDLTLGGDITLGDADTDSVSFGADIDSNLIPNTDDTYDLGSATKAWQDLFLEGDITLTDAGTIQTSAGVLTIDGAGGLTLDSDGTDAVNLGTEAVAKTITVGNAASTMVDINALALDFDSAAATDILAATTLSAKGTTGKGEPFGPKDDKDDKPRNRLWGPKGPFLGPPAKRRRHN